MLIRVIRGYNLLNLNSTLCPRWLKVAQKKLDFCPKSGIMPPQRSGDKTNDRSQGKKTKRVAKEQKRVGASRPIDASKSFSPGTCGRGYCNPLVLRRSKHVLHGVGIDKRSSKTSDARQMAENTSKINYPQSRIKWLTGQQNASSIQHPASISESFSQNKPNLPDTKMNVTNVITKEYENAPLRKLAENKPNQTQLSPNMSIWANWKVLR